MTTLQALVLGFVQGATEWLPVSSTAHLRIVPALLRWPDPGAPFTAIVQWGTVLAAIVYFRRDVLGLFVSRGARGGPQRRLLLPIAVGSVPIAVAGYLLESRIEEDWRSLYVVAGAMVAFSVLQALAEARYKARRGAPYVSVADGLVVGIGQAFALIPGASRSGVTITASLLLGMERSLAARLSFLLSLPAAFGAGLKECWDERAAILATELCPLATATSVAFVVGIASIHWFVGFLARSTTYSFVVYRVVLAVVILTLVGLRLVPAV